MKMKRTLSVLLSLCMIFSLLSSNVAFAAESGRTVQELELEQLTGNGKHYFSDSLKDSDSTLDQAVADDELVKVFIIMEGKSVLESNSEAQLNRATRYQMQRIEKRQNAVIADIEADVLDGQELAVSYQYSWITNAVAATVPYGSIRDIAAVDGVVKVLRQRTYSVCEIAEPKTNSDGVMIGREDTWANGYTGEGMKIAIIDTGIDTGHQNFGALAEEKLTTRSATEDFVADKLAGLQAASRYQNLTAADVYYSSKIAYGFNYCDNNLDITHKGDSQGDHGTHVAGIAAANKVDGSDVVGVAPDAQLYIMKVFGANGGAYDEDILAALEDAMMLEADVVNMSLGSTAGFTTDGEEIDAIYNSVGQTGVVLSIAAGNEYTSAFMNNYGLDQSLTENMDNATVGSPGTYANAMTVASVENLFVYDYYLSVGEQKISYSEGAYGVNRAISTLADGTAYGIVAIPGYGDVADYEGLDVSGKIALVQRGELSFGDKTVNAENAGAIACIVYNNVSGGAPGVSLEGCEATIPMASISMGDGQRIIAMLAEDASVTMTFSDEAASIPSDTAWEMSEFSSWGVAPNLTLEPDITAPGGNIYSTRDDGSYGLMSGTSMATPNVAGLAALVSQYAQDLGYSGAELHSFVYALLMSTSEPLSYDDETLYSPRSQGSGLANAFNAVTTRAWLSVPGCDVPKANLFDDKDRSGSFDFSFLVNNDGDRDLYFGIDTTAQTEGVNTDYEEQGYTFMSSTPVNLAAQTTESSDALRLTYDVDNSGATGSHDAWHIYQAAVAGTPADENWREVSFRYDTDGNEAAEAADVQAYLDALVGNDSPADLEDTVLCVAAGEAAEISVSIQLDQADVDYFNTYYTNGGYVEGFTLLSARTAGAVDLSLPYLGFYGDWTDAPMLDSGYYWEDEATMKYSQYPHVLYTNYTYYGQEQMVALGTNPYVEEAYDLSHFSVSPNEDGYGDLVSDMYISLLRNVATLTVTYTDAVTGEVYSSVSGEHLSKSVYSSGYGQIVPTVWSWYDAAGYDFTDADGNPLPNNSKLLLTVTAEGIDYEGDQPESFQVPITVDTEAPTIEKAELTIDENTGAKTMTLTMKDNVSAAAVLLVDSLGMMVYGQYAVEDVTPSADGYQHYTVSYDVTDIDGKVMLIVGDYAFNESYYGVNMGGEGVPYGEFVAFENDTYGGYTWVSFDKDVNYSETTIAQSATNFVCSEYINGYLFAQTSNGKLYAIRYSDMLGNGSGIEATYLADLSYVYQDLAYDYANGRLLGLYTTERDGSVINEINLGEAYYDEDSWSEIPAFGEKWIASYGMGYGLAMACDDAGTIYLLGPVYDWDTGDWTENAWLIESYITQYGTLSFQQVADTETKADYRQSATWNHNDESLYWAQFYPTASFLQYSTLYQVNTETAKLTECGSLSGEAYSLTAPLTADITGHDNVPAFDATEIATPILNKSLMTLNVGGLEQLICTFEPWYSQVTDVTWSSSNEEIATVSNSGVVLGVAPGSCEITVTSVADPSRSASCTVNVAALDLSISGFVAYSAGGVGTAGASRYYTMDMVGGHSSLNIEDKLVVPAEFAGMGTSMSASVLARDSLWAAEWGNTGIVYQIDPETNTVVDYIQSINGGHSYGLAYSKNTDRFTSIMNFYMDVDLNMDHDMEQKMIDSYDETIHDFTYHRIDMSSLLSYSDEGFATGEANYGSVVDVVLCGITDIDEPYTYEMDGYKDFMGENDWNRSGVNYAGINYTSATTHVLLDNVGRLWYVDEIPGFKTMTSEYEDYDWETGETITVTSTYYYNAADTDSAMSGEGMLFEGSNLPSGMFFLEDPNDEGTATATCFFVRKLEKTPLYDMYKDGTMPRYSYSFSGIAYAGKDNNGGDMFAITLYDYWNNGNTNQMYLYTSGSSYFDWDLYEDVTVGRALYSLGDMGVGNMVATIHSVEVTGGLPEAETTAPETAPAHPAGVSSYQR